MTSITGEKFHSSKNPTTFKILRCSNEDIESILPPLGSPSLEHPPLGNPPLGNPPLGNPPLEYPLGSPSLGNPPLGNPFTDLDAFELVKERIVNRTPELESQGYSLATYVASGDYIEMKSAFFLSSEQDTGGGTVTPACVATEISFVPKVRLTGSKTKVTLRVSLLVEGVNVLRSVDSDDYLDITFTPSDLENNSMIIAENIFLYGSRDLMRINNVGDYFDHLPRTSLEDSTSEISITGLSGNANTPVGKFTNKESVLIFRTIGNLAPNVVDFTKEQWGEEKSVYSCQFFEYTNS